MPNLRKRASRVSYIESSGEEDDSDLKENFKSRARSKSSVRRGRTPKRRRIDADPDVDFAVLKSDSEEDESKAKGMNLSESGSDSEREEKSKKQRQTRTKRAKPRVSKKTADKTEEEFDWSQVVPEEKEGKNDTSDSVMRMEEDEDDDDEDDWEDVGDADATEESSERPAPSGIDITVSGDGSLARKPKKVDLEAELRREVARRERLAQGDMHIVHLLCLLAHGRGLSSACSCPDVTATALSLLPSVDDQQTKKKLQRVLKAMRDVVRLERDKRHPEAVDEDVEGQIADILGSGRAPTAKLRVLAVCALLRASGLRVRLVHVLRPVPLKPPTNAKGKAKSKPKPKRKSEEGKGRKMLSEDEEEEEEEEGPCRAAWWLEALCDDRWVTVDPHNEVVDDPAAMERKEHREGPLYVVGFEAAGACRDVTAKYASRWCSLTRKLRLSSDAWEEEVMRALRTEGERNLDAKEDDEIRQRLLQLAPPKSTGDYNNHPLYALTRHLKKYEVIYPPDAGVLHSHKGEPVFARENVRLCHTRETWLKEARVVKLGEQPAKVVLSRTTSKQRALLPSGQAEIELYGLWQTEEFVPPVARDGIVPKNEHGNVDLFQERMMPVGCVRLRLPGLGRIARRLEIDVAQAMVGWEFHAGRWAHPVFDGWIVCREHVSTLSYAWLEAERALQKKAAAQREDRAVANWRLLVRGLMIRKRLQARYEFKGSAEASRVSSIADGMKQRSGRK